MEYAIQKNAKFLWSRITERVKDSVGDIADKDCICRPASSGGKHQLAVGLLFIISV